jgi:hypothetical protein
MTHRNISNLVKAGNTRALNNRINLLLRTIANWREQGPNRKLKATKTPMRAVMRFKNFGTLAKLMNNSDPNKNFRNTIPNPRRGIHIIQGRRVTHKISRNANTGNFSVKNLESNRVMKFPKGTRSLERKWREFFRNKY